MKKYLLLSLVFYFTILNAQIQDTIWSRYDSSPWTGSRANSAELANGDAIVAMSDNSIAIIGTDGTVKWDTTLTNEFKEIWNIVTYDDAYYVVGKSADVPSQGKIYTKSTSAAATTKSFSSFETITDIVMANGRYYATATSNLNRPYLLKLDVNLDTLFAKNMYIASWNQATDIDYENDGELVMAGFWDDYPAMWKYDTTGNEIWRYDSAQFISLAHAEIIPTVQGYTYIGRNLLIQVDDNGNFQSEVSYGRHSFFGIIPLTNSTLLYGYYIDANGINHPEVVAVDNNYKIIDSLWFDPVPATNYVSSFYGGNAMNQDAVLLNGEFDTGNSGAITLYLSADSTLIGIDEKSKEVAFKMYPNPTGNIFNISSENNIDQVNVFDGRGKLIKTSKFSFERNVTVDLKEFNDGFYIIKLIDSHGRQSSAILIKH